MAGAQDWFQQKVRAYEDQLRQAQAAAPKVVRPRATGLQGARGPVPVVQQPAAPGVQPYDVYLPTVTRGFDEGRRTGDEGQQVIQGAVGVSAPPVWTPPSERIGQDWEWLQGINRAIQEWERPQWFQDVADWAHYVTTGTERRMEERWQRPEERARVPVAALPSFEERMRTAQEELAGVEGWQQYPAAFLKAAGVLGAPAGQAWEQATQRSGLARTLERLGAVGLQALEEPARAAKQVIGAGAVGLHPEARGLEVKEWAPLAEIVASLGRKQLQKASPFREGWTAEGGVAAEALRRVKRGEQAEAVAAELEDPIAELVFEMAVDPLNALDFVGVATKARRAQDLTQAERTVAKALDNPKVAEELRGLERALASTADDGAQALRVAAEAAGEPIKTGTWEKVRRTLAAPFELVPEAKADRDLGELWIVVSGPLSEVETAEEAVDLVRRWGAMGQPGAAGVAEDLTRRYGATVQSPAGQKAGVIMRHVADQAADLPSVKAAQMGQPFNPAHFLVELTDTAQGALRQAYGAKEPSRLQKFIEGYKGLQSEFYLTGIYSPGYLMRNLASDLFTMAVDGVGTFERRTNIDDFLGRLGGPTTRRITTEGRGARELLTGIPEGESRLPGVFGTISKKGQELTRQAEPLGRLPLGEEPRYRRAYYSALKRFLDANTLQRTPDVPQALRRVLGEQGAENLRAAVAQGLSGQEKRGAVERVLGAASPGQGIEVTRYLDIETMDAMSPEMVQRLRGRLAELPPGAGPAEVQGVFAEAAGWVNEAEAAALQGAEVVPGRKVATAVEEAELAEAVVVELRRMAEQVGDPGLMQQVDAVAARMAELERELGRARDAAVEAAQAMPLERGQDALVVMLEANLDADRMRDATRGELGRLMKEAREAYQKNPQAGGAIWPEYFGRVAQGWEELAGARVARFQTAQAQLGQLAQGARLEDLGLMTQRERAERLLQQASQIPEVVTAPAEYVPGSVLAEAESADFDRFLQARRSEVDALQAQAWRAGFGAVPERYGDVLDLLDSAARDVDFYGKRAAGEVAIARNAMLDEIADLMASRRGNWKAAVRGVAERYYKERNRLWSEFFEQARERWRGSELDVARLEGAGAVGRRRAEEVAGGVGRRTVEEGRRARAGLTSGVVNPEGTVRVEYRRPAAEGRPFEVDYLDPMGKVIETRAANSEREAQWLAEMGQREADLRARTVPSGEVSVVGLHQVPEGSVKSKVVKRGPRWELQYYDEQGRVMEAYDFGTRYPSAKAAKKRADVVIEQRARGVEVPGRLREPVPARPDVEVMRPAELIDLEAEPGRFVLEGEEAPGRLREPVPVRADIEGMTPAEAELIDLEAEPGRFVLEGEEAPTGAEGFEEWERRWQAEMRATEAERMRREYPQDLEDAARLWMYEPEEMTGEEWGRVSFHLREEANRAAELSTPAGVDAAADRAAHTGEMITMEVGGFTRETRARALSRRQQAEFRRGILGQWADEPREFYKRQRALADWYNDLADDALVRAGGGQPEARRLPDVLLEQEARVARQAEEQTAAVRGAVEQARGELAEARVRLEEAEAGAEKRHWRGKVRSAEDRLYRAELKAKEAGVDLARVDAEKVGAYNRAMAETGAGEAPTRAAMAQAQAEATRRGLAQMEAGVLDEWGTWRPVVEDEAVRRVALAWLDEVVMPAWQETRATALKYAKDQSDFALLDYGKRRRFDTWLGLVTPYSYWYTRSGWNWGKRLAGRPGMLAQYLRAREAMRQANEQAGRRARFGTKVRIPFPWLPDWMGDAIYVDPLRMVVPFGTFVDTRWEDAEESRRGLRAIMEGLGDIGFRPYHFLDLPYRAGWLARAGEAMGMEKAAAERLLAPERQGEFGLLLPQTKVVRGLTALAREAGVEELPPGGINIEAPLRRAMGLPAGEVWDPYRTGRMLANMAAERPQDEGLARAALMGQELLRRDVDQVGRVWSAESELAQQVAAEMGWTVEELSAAQGLLQEAMQRAALEQGVGTVGWALGPSMAIEPRGERQRLELMEQAREQGWAPGRMEGTREAYQVFKRAHPAVYPHSSQYELVPGGEEGYYSPGARANWMARERAKEQINAEYDRRVDDLLRGRPWDSKGRSALEEERRAALDEVEAQWVVPTGEFEAEEIEGMPAARYGQSPAEYAEMVAEEEARTARNSAPSPEDYTNSAGETNWEGYFAERERWEAGLAESTPALEAVAAMGGRYAGMSLPEVVETYGQRYDSPLEAALEVYQEAVSGPAWDAYWAARDAGREDAWDTTVGAVGRVRAVDLVPEILQVYRGKGWTAEALERELGGVVFPSMEEQREQTKKDEGRRPEAGGGVRAAGEEPGWYAEKAERVREEGWRNVYGRPWWEKYGRGLHPVAGRRSGGGIAWGTPARWGARSPVGRWRPPGVVYGGPRFGR